MGVDLPRKSAYDVTMAYKVNDMPPQCSGMSGLK